MTMEQATDEARAVAADLAHAWGDSFPETRFSGTPAGARMSVKPQEAVDLAELAYRRGLADAARQTILGRRVAWVDPNDADAPSLAGQVTYVYVVLDGAGAMAADIGITDPARLVLDGPP